jgi:head-tail adaptor
MITDFFNSTVTIQRKNAEDDEAGNWTEEWLSLVVNLRCCIQPRSGREWVVHDKRQSEVSHVMYCLPLSQELRESDRVVRGTTEFDVIAKRDVDYLGRFWTIDLKEVKAA